MKPDEKQAPEIVHILLCSDQIRSEFILFKTDAFEFMLLFTIISAILESFLLWIYLQPLIFYFWYLILKKETRFGSVWNCSIVGSNWWMQLEYVTIKKFMFFFSVNHEKMLISSWGLSYYLWILNLGSL